MLTHLLSLVFSTDTFRLQSKGGSYISFPGRNATTQSDFDAGAELLSESGKNGKYVFRDHKNNKVLDIDRGAMKIIEYSFHGGNNQNFKTIDMADGYFNIIWTNGNKDYCFSETSGEMALRFCDGQDDQEFKKVSTKPVVPEPAPSVPPAPAVPVVPDYTLPLPNPIHPIDLWGNRLTPYERMEIARRNCPVILNQCCHQNSPTRTFNPNLGLSAGRVTVSTY